jgi:rhamnosyltransferase
VIPVAPGTFDHGGTRQAGLLELNDCEIVVCLTQDALLDTPDAIARLVAAFDDPTVAVAWGRQLPHQDANPIARHARHFNYPADARVVSIADAATLGIKVGFCSNSFCAWRRDALLGVGGFPRPALLAEDMLAALSLLKAGHRVAYVASACVRHSHNFSPMAEFRRYFDTGVTHHHYSKLLAVAGSPNAEGWRFVKSEWQALGRSGWSWRLRALAHTAAKWLGYQLGRQSTWMPRQYARALSAYPAWPGWLR